VAAPRAGGYDWTLEFAPGPEPGDGEFIEAASGSGSGPFDGKLGEIDLSQVPESFWSAAFELSSTKTLETNDQYTVTIRLRVTDDEGRVGEERRAIAVTHDETWSKGFPRRIRPGMPGGESQPTLGDLRGGRALEVVLGDTDGRVHVLNGRTGRELPGFPVHTRRTRVEKRYPGVNPGFEPLFTNVAIGDLGGRGRQSIVAASSTGRVYVWDARGRLPRRWPKTLDTGVEEIPSPRPSEPFTRPPIRGASAPPVLVNLDSDRALEIAQSGWDGRIHAWNGNGRRVAGWPVHVTLPDGTGPPNGWVTINDQKLDLPPTLAELDGDPEVELLQRTQYSFAAGGGLVIPNQAFSNVVAYNHDGSRVPGFLISGEAFAFYYGSAQEFITEGVNNPSTADVDGDGLTEIASAAGIFSSTTLYDPDGSENIVYGPVPGGTLALMQGNPAALLEAFNGQLPDDAPVNFTTSGGFGRFGAGDQLSYAEPGSGGASVASSLLLAGSGLPINSYMRAYNAQTGAGVPGMPAKSQGLHFLGAPAIADVDGDGSPELIEGGDSSALHAFTATGDQAAGFPKFHTGWVLFSPAVGDIDGDGKNEVVAATREGYVMAWDTEGDAEANEEWWGYRHDERNTGMYGIDTRSPSKLRRARASGRTGKLRFLGPGDDWSVGQVDHYVLRLQTGRSDAIAVGPPERIEPSGSAGTRERLKLGRQWRGFKIFAVDDEGNRGPAVKGRVPSRFIEAQVVPSRQR
jgi:hypothetical protein